MRWLFVIARNSSFAYKGRAIDVRQIGHELGVRYLLEGSVRKAADRVRITAQLIEAATGAHLWAERYDRDLADTFRRGGRNHRKRRGRDRAGAAESRAAACNSQGSRNHGRMGPIHAGHVAVLPVYCRRQCRSRRPSCEGRSNSTRHTRKGISACRGFLPKGSCGMWSDDIDADRQTGHAAARRAVELDDRDSYSHYVLAWQSLLNLDHGVSIAAAQRAIDLAPNFALGYFVLGAARVFFGRFEQAADAFQRGMRLSPHEPMAFFYGLHLALARYHQGHYEEAAEIVRARHRTSAHAHVVPGTRRLLWPARPSERREGRARRDAPANVEEHRKAVRGRPSLRRSCPPCGSHRWTAQSRLGRVAAAGRGNRSAPTLQLVAITFKEGRDISAVGTTRTSTLRHRRSALNP